MHIIPLFLAYSISSFRRSLALIAVAFIGLSLAVALFVSIQLANSSVLREFESTLDVMTDASMIELVNRTGSVPESLVSQVLKAPGVLSVEPFSTAIVKRQGSNGRWERTTLIGVDVLARAKELFSSPDDSESSGNIVSDLLSYRTVIMPKYDKGSPQDDRVILSMPSGKPKAFHVLGMSKESEFASIFGGNTVVADISLFQEFTGTHASVDRLSIKLKKDAKREIVKSHLQDILPSQVIVSDRDESLLRIASSSKALRMNLSFLSMLSLFVAILLSYQIMSLLLMKRRGDFSVLISLGASPRALCTLVLVEAAVFGAASGLFGALTGRFLSIYTIESVQQTISQLYTPLWDRSLPLSLDGMGVGIILGISGAIAGALIPSFTLFTTPPRTYFMSGILARQGQNPILFSTSIGVLFVFLALATSSQSFISHISYGAFCAPLLFCCATICFAPLLMSLFRNCANRLQWSPLLIATDWLTSRRRDNALTIGALAVAFGMLIGVSSMIGSFRETFEVWLKHILSADLFVAEEQDATTSKVRSRSEMLQYLITDSRVAEVHTGVESDYVHNNRNVLLRSTNFRLANKYNSYVFLSSASLDWETLYAGQQVLVSESFSRKHGTKVGDVLSLSLPQGQYSPQIAGIFQDYSSDLGAVVMQQEVFSRYVGDGDRGLGISVYLNHKQDAKRLLTELRETFARGWSIQDQKALSSKALDIFDQTFQITYVLQILTLAISTLFFLNTMIITVLEKQRESLTLRSIGAPLTFLSLILICMIFAILLCTFFLGTSLGVVLSWYLVYRINVLFFGWLVHLSVPFQQLTIAATGLLVVGCLVTFLLAYFLMRKIPLSKLRYE